MFGCLCCDLMFNVPLVANHVSDVTKPCAVCQVMCCDLTSIVCIRCARFSGGCGGLTLNVVKGLAYVKPMYGLCQAGLCQANVYVCYFNR